MDNIEVKPREVIICVAITALMIALGSFMSGRVGENARARESVYRTAVQAKDKETFDYAVETQQGYIIAGGAFKVKDPVTYPELKDEYAYVKKSKEVYTRKERQVAVYDKDGNISHYETEVYWEWDYHGSESKQSKTITFQEKDYPIDQWRLPPSSNYGQYHYTSRHVRYYYRVVPKKFDASFICRSKGEGLQPPFSDTGGVPLDRRSMEQLTEDGSNQAAGAVLLFWILWGIAIIAANIGFIALENKYLD